eukprot:gene14682-44054_t
MAEAAASVAGSGAKAAASTAEQRDGSPLEDIGAQLQKQVNEVKGNAKQLVDT